LLLAFIRATPLAGNKERRKAEEFFGRLVGEALKADQEVNSNELCKALVAASESARKGKLWGRLIVPTASARQVLEQFAQNPRGVSEGRLLLAVAVVEYFEDAESREALRAALERVLKLARPTAQEARANDRMAASICGALVRIAPAELLIYAEDREPIRTTLRSYALRWGWLVFDSRIVDAEGREVCRLGDQEQDDEPFAKPPELVAILDVCTETEREALLGYCLMVMAGGPCHPNDPFKSIYDALESFLNERTEEMRDDQGKRRDKPSRGQTWQDQMRRKLPVYSNWVRYLKRARAHVKKELPSAIPWLHEMGLFRGRSR
jgi:hypothetical protein